MGEQGRLVWLVANGSFIEHFPVAVLGAALQNAGYRCRAFGTSTVGDPFRQRGIPFESHDGPPVLHKLNAEGRAWLRRCAADMDMSGPDMEEDLLIFLHVIETEYLWRFALPLEEEEAAVAEVRASFRRYADIFVGRVSCKKLSFSAFHERVRLCEERQAKEMEISIEECKAVRLKSFQEYVSVVRQFARERQLKAMDLAMAVYKAWESTMSIDGGMPARVADFFAWQQGEDMNGYWGRWSRLLPLRREIYSRRHALGSVVWLDHLVRQNLILTLDAVLPEQMPHLVICSSAFPSLYFDLQARRNIQTLQFRLDWPQFHLDRVAHRYSSLKEADLDDGSEAPTPLEELGPWGFIEMDRRPRQLFGVSALGMLESLPPCLRNDAERLNDLRACFTGAWATPQEEFSGKPEEEERLTEFLSAGADLPVCIGWGEMPAEWHYGGPMHLALVVAEAMRQAGVRIIFVALFTGVTRKMLEEAAGKEKERVCWTSAPPPDWLFPRCACSVQDGDTPIIEAALRAGLPVVITPGTYQQEAKAQWVTSLALGLVTSPVARVTGQELGDAIKWVLQDEVIKSRAREAREFMEAEPGVTGAVELVDRFLEEGEAAFSFQAPATSPEACPWREGRYGIYKGNVKESEDILYRGPTAFGSDGQQVGWLRHGTFVKEDEVWSVRVIFCVDEELNGDYRWVVPNLFIHDTSPGCSMWYRKQRWFMGYRSATNTIATYSAGGYKAWPPPLGWAPTGGQVGIQQMPIVIRWPQIPNKLEEIVQVRQCGMSELNTTYTLRTGPESAVVFYGEQGRSGAESGVQIWSMEDRSRWFMGRPKDFSGRAAFLAEGDSQGLIPGGNYRLQADAGGADPAPIVLVGDEGRQDCQPLTVRDCGCAGLRGRYVGRIREKDGLRFYAPPGDPQGEKPGMWFDMVSLTWYLGFDNCKAIYQAQGHKWRPPPGGWRLGAHGVAGEHEPMPVVVVPLAAGLEPVQDQERQFFLPCREERTKEVQYLSTRHPYVCYGHVADKGMVLAYTHGHHVWLGI